METVDEPKITMKTIKKCVLTIRQNMNRDALAPHLYSLLTHDEMYHFTSDQKSSGESCDYLIGILESKGSNAAQIFLECLQQETEHIGHAEIVDVLRKIAALQKATVDDSEEVAIDQPLDNDVTDADEEPAYSEKKLKEKYKKSVQVGYTQKIYDDLTAEQKEILDEVQAMIIVVNDSEFMATMSYLKPPDNCGQILEVHCKIKLRHAKDPQIFYIGMYGKCLVAVVRVEQGCGIDALNHSDRFKNILLIAAVGVAAGFPENNVKLGDVLISQKITDCSIYKQQDGIYIARGNTASASKYMITRLKNKFQWDFVCTSKDAKSSVIIGQFLSKPLLLDDKEERRKILEHFGKEAKGYEMEGFSIAGGAIDCIIVKGVCDFASGKNKKWQPTAALAANDYLYHHLSQMDLSNMKDDVQKGNVSVEPSISSYLTPIQSLGHLAAYPNQTGVYELQQDGREHQVQPPHQPPHQPPQLQRQPQPMEPDGNVNSPVMDEEPDSGVKQIVLDINNTEHHIMIIELGEHLDKDKVDYRKLYRFFQLTEEEKSKIEDSRSGHMYETLSQYVETKKPTINALIKNLQHCKVAQEHIEFVTNCIREC